MKNRIAAAAALLLLGVGTTSAQTTAFHKLVVVGDSLAAGHEANCTVERYQRRGASALLAEALGIADFQQPLLAETPATNPPTSYPCLGAVVVGGSIGVGIISQEGAQLNATLPRPYDNLGFNGGPRVKDFVDLRVSVPGRSDLDNYAARVLRNVAGSPFEGTNAVEQAASLAPDLALYWVGNNDLLGAATTGVVVDGVTLTPVDAFRAKYVEGLTTIFSAGPTVVTFTIPNVTSIPLFTTLPPVVIDPATRQPVIIDGHPVPLLGSRALPPDCPVAPCPLPNGTLLNTIRAGLLLQQGIGVPAFLGGRAVQGSGNLTTALPYGTITASGLQPGVVLYPDGLAAILARTTEINDVIRSISAEDGTVLVDLNTLFQDVAANGYHIGGVTLTSAFLSGGLFSADGVHPSAAGYAILADYIIQAINTQRPGISPIPRPNLGAALFTPNVPPFGTAVTMPGFHPDKWLLDLPVFEASPPAAEPLSDRRPSTRTVAR